jgi:5'-nucleotidase/UDP-sugar diphosphatase
VADFRGRLIPMWESEAVPDPAVEALARTFDARIDSLYGQVLADLRTDWFTSSRGESNLGSWITDRLREAAGADVAVMNSGGIRKSLPKGPITILDVKEVLPFDNVLERFECTGEDLLALARSNAQGQAGGEEGVVQISGLRYRWRRSASGEAVVEAVEVGGKPVEKARTYLVAGPDYTLAHYDRFLGFEPKGVRSLGVTVTEIVIDAVREAGVIESGVDGRMEEIR